MGLIDTVNQLITEHGSAAILKERLLLLRDQLEKLQSENKRLTDENARLQTENTHLYQKLAQKTATEEFVKHRGVLFLRLPDGKIQDEVYCPKCRHPMVSFEKMIPFDCDACRVTANFTGSDLRRIIAEIH